jgi:uncharacterized protein (DUF1499 family)
MKYLLLVLFVIIISCAGERPLNIGLVNGQLTELADKPNCVSTTTQFTDKKMPAIAYTKPESDVLLIIVQAISDFGDAEIISQDSNYIHAEFTTGIGWVDDVEFYLNRTKKQIEFRSASRIGHSDFGTNRERMEKMTVLIKKQL